MSKITFVSLGTPDPEQSDAFNTYVETASKLFTAGGGVPIKRARVTEVLLGDSGPATVFLMEFPSADEIKEVLGSADYQRIVPFRDKAFKELTFLLAEAF